MSNTVTLTLAHPLTAQQVERLHAKEVRDYRQGDKITVPQDDARAIINAGYADGVDPENQEQTQSALGTTAAPPKAPKVSS